MLQELADKSEKQGLKMNKSKTNVMIENDRPMILMCHILYISNTQIEDVESYIYLGHRYSTRDKTQNREIHRRITAGWIAFAKYRDIFNSKIGTCMNKNRIKFKVNFIHFTGSQKRLNCTIRTL